MGIDYKYLNWRSSRDKLLRLGDSDRDNSVGERSGFNGLVEAIHLFGVEGETDLARTGDLDITEIEF